MHSIGDASTETVLDALEKMPKGSPLNRIGIAHVEFADATQHERMSKVQSRFIMSFQWAQNNPGWNSKNTSEYDTHDALGGRRMDEAGM